MKEITLTRGNIALVDDEDFERLNKFSWHTLVNKKYPHIKYARTTLRLENGKRKSFLMHRFLLGVQEVDHRNRNGLDNTRQNLRECTQSQNCANSRAKRTPGRTSLFKGIYFHTGHKKWVASITRDGKRSYLGDFVDEIEAAKAYDVAAKEVFGDFAKLNLA